MSNPYAAPDGPAMQPSTGEVRRVAVQPYQRLMRAKEMLGDQYWTFVGICFVGVFIGSLFAIVLMGPMMCGIYYCYMMREKGPVQFDMVFKGFDYFLEGFLTVLISTLSVMVIIIPVMCVFGMVGGTMASAMDDPEAGGVLFAILYPIFWMVYIAAIVFVSVPFTFAFQLIVDRKMKAMDAIKLSWQGAKANLGGLVGMYFLYMVLGMLASCACYFPIFFLMPLSFGAIFTLYRDVFPREAKPNPGVV